MVEALHGSVEQLGNFRDARQRPDDFYSVLRCRFSQCGLPLFDIAATYIVMLRMTGLEAASVSRHLT